MTIEGTVGGPVVRMLSFHYRGYRLDPLLGDLDPTALWYSQKKRMTIGTHFTLLRFYFYSPKYLIQYI